MDINYKDDRYNGYAEKHNNKDCCNDARKVILECGFNPQSAIFEIRNDDVRPNQHFDLDKLAIDTTGLCRPLVKLEFSSLVSFEVETENDEIEVELLFELERICRGNKETIQSWCYKKGFETSPELEVEICEPFTVTFCDRPCPGCCEYKMTVKGKDFDGDFKHLSVTKPNLTAIAQGTCSDY